MTSKTQIALCIAAIVYALFLPAVVAAKRGTHDPGRTHYRAPQAQDAPIIDGVADESAWKRAPWHTIAHRWLGPAYPPTDFQGRFKVVWTSDKIYVLGEFVDDVLFDSHRDPLVQYWDDDCLEVFIDEDHSGGNHQYNHNAFAYHVSLDNQAIDIGTDKLPHNYSHHVMSRWKQHSNKLTWELAIDIYADDYVDGSGKNAPIKLSVGKVMGLMLAWCDNDGSPLRESFVGSEFAAGDKKDRGWIDAGLFGTLTLIK